GLGLDETNATIDSDTVFDHNNPAQPNYPSLRRNIRCGRGTILSAESLFIFKETGKEFIASQNSLWINQESGCRLSGQLSNGDNAQFTPVLNRADGRLSDDELKLTIAFYGSTLIPCSDVITAFQIRRTYSPPINTSAALINTKLYQSSVFNKHLNSIQSNILTNSQQSSQQYQQQQQINPNLIPNEEQQIFQFNIQPVDEWNNESVVKTTVSLGGIVFDGKWETRILYGDIGSLIGTSWVPINMNPLLPLGGQTEDDDDRRRNTFLILFIVLLVVFIALVVAVVLIGLCYVHEKNKRKLAREQEGIGRDIILDDEEVQTDGREGRYKEDEKTVPITETQPYTITEALPVTTYYDHERKKSKPTPKSQKKTIEKKPSPQKKQPTPQKKPIERKPVERKADVQQVQKVVKQPPPPSTDFLTGSYDDDKLSRSFGQRTEFLHNT
ncbi:MAG: hypothetical protein EZS28_044497, partial [Streblomastix strix]